MKTRISVSLNGKQLHELDDLIIIQSVNESKPNMTRSTASTTGLNGMFMTSFERQSIDVTVSFSIRTVRDYKKRIEVLDKVNAWAIGGGLLRTNYQDGKVLSVVCDGLAGAANVKEWTGEYDLLFKAYAIPYWQGSVQSFTWERKNSVSATIKMNGTTKSVMSFEVNNTSKNKVDRVTVSTGQSSITFDGMGLEPGESLVMAYNGRNTQYINIYKSDGTLKKHANGCRTKESSDELVVNSGNNSISISCPYSVDFRLYGRGRWL